MNEILLNRVAFSIFGVDIYFYGILITLAIIVAFLIAFALCKRKNIPLSTPYDILIAILPLGIICARLFAVLFDSSLSITDYFKFREGGMSILGAIIGGAIGITILCIVKKRKFLEITDIVCVVLILAQAIGRWGNYFNGELYGQEILDPAYQVFPIAVKIGEQFFEALFFYESMLNLVGFVVLICLYWFIKNKGVATAVYFIYYGVVRFCLEPRRQSEFILKLGNIEISWLLSLFMIIIGVSLLVYIIIKFVKDKNKEKKSGNKEVLHSN